MFLSILRMYNNVYSLYWKNLHPLPSSFILLDTIEHSNTHKKKFRLYMLSLHVKSEILGLFFFWGGGEDWNYFLSTHFISKRKRREFVFFYNFDMAIHCTSMLIKTKHEKNLLATVQKNNICIISLFFFQGTKVGLLNYIIHHNPEYWPEPEVFRPERLFRIFPYIYNTWLRL